MILCPLLIHTHTLIHPPHMHTLMFWRVWLWRGKKKVPSLGLTQASPMPWTSWESWQLGPARVSVLASFTWRYSSRHTSLCHTFVSILSPNTCSFSLVSVTLELWTIVSRGSRAWGVGTCRLYRYTDIEWNPSLDITEW